MERRSLEEILADIEELTGPPSLEVDIPMSAGVQTSFSYEEDTDQDPRPWNDPGLDEVHWVPIGWTKQSAAAYKKGISESEYLSLYHNYERSPIDRTRYLTYQEAIDQFDYEITCFLRIDGLE